MKSFDKVIGYQSIKRELKQICDMMQNKEVYEAIGATLPQGLLLYGEPGLGKTLMAKCVIAESGVKTFTVRKNKGSDDFVAQITETFHKAKENAPCIVFLDDMDKFANMDNHHRDAEEYVAVQSGIDEVRDCGVFVLATANDIHKMPFSLLRAGRFDRHVEVCEPTPADAAEIIRHYLKKKKVADDVNLDDLCKMIHYSSCAELEAILNEAAIQAAYERRKSIRMKDLVDSVLRTHYDAPDIFVKPSEEEMKKVALHEAGHLVVSEVLCEESVGLASLRGSGRDKTNGFIRNCKRLTRRPFEILVSLAGKAAVELYYSETCASGCHSDIEKAFYHIRGAISEIGTCGFGMIDVSTRRFPETSESLNARNESVVQAELERYFFKAKDILLKNRDFLEKATELLLKKETLLFSDIKKLRGECTVTEVAV